MCFIWLRNTDSELLFTGNTEVVLRFFLLHLKLSADFIKKQTDINNLMTVGAKKLHKMVVLTLCLSSQLFILF